MQRMNGVVQGRWARRGQAKSLTARTACDASEKTAKSSPTSLHNMHENPRSVSDVDIHRTLCILYGKRVKADYERDIQAQDPERIRCRKGFQLNPCEGASAVIDGPQSDGWVLGTKKLYTGRPPPVHA